MKRLDVYLFERGLFPSLARAQASILAGEVWSRGQRLDKAGHLVKEGLEIEVRSQRPAFSSRAGLKLEAALKLFHVEVKDRWVMDVGASTGGFTDCLLKAGATGVVAVDVGYGLLDQKLRSDNRVVNLEKTNARYLSSNLVPAEARAKLSLATMDVSFISSRTLLEHLVKEFPQIEAYVVLFKPQFEVAPEFIRKGGIVSDDAAIARALDSYIEILRSKGLVLASPVECSPLSGKKSGNVERLIHFIREGQRDDKS